METHVSEHDIVRLLDLLDTKDVIPWIDGGWGIDALLGRQTRRHGDLDLVIEDRHEAATLSVLRAEGFREDPMWFTTPVHTVWHHEDGRAVDLHVIALDADGNGVYGDEGTYPAEALTGRGTIGNREVRCISAAAQAEFHRGYTLTDKDRHDVGLLHSELGIPLPPEYET